MNIPIAGVVTTLVIILLEVGFYTNTEAMSGLPYLQPTADDGVVIAKRSLLQEDSTDSIVILGDSSALHGLVPSVVTEETNTPTLNYGALSSLTTVGFTEMGLSILEHSEPSAIVYALLPQSLEVTESDAREFRQLSRYLIAYGSKLDLYDITLSERLGLFRKKHQFNTFPPQFEGDYQRFESAIKDQKGFYPEKSKRFEVEDYKEKFTPTKFSLEAIVQMNTAAEEKGIPFFVVLNPKPENSVSDEYVQQVSDFIAKTQKEHPNIRFLANEYRSLPSENFGTETHLLPRAAREHSRIVSEQLNIN